MIHNRALRPAMQLVYSNDFSEIWKDETIQHASLFSTRSFRPGDIICEVGASAIVHTPSYLTVQIEEDEHICLNPQFLQYINHGCSPNVFFDIANGKVICLRPIKPGTEFSYFYPSTEWDMAQPFQCLCGSRNCLNYIRGAKHIPKDVLSKYRVSDFIKRKKILQELTTEAR